MGKRFTETEKWSDRWFASLNVQHKLFWIYLCDTCDPAGVWDEPLVQAAVRLGIDDFDFDSALQVYGDRVQVLKDGSWWLVKFVSFQNPRGLSETANYHKAVFASALKHGLDPSLLVNPCPSLDQDLPKTRPRDQGKDKDKDKDKEQDKDFQAFWTAYPKKTGKGAALKAWSKVKPPLTACLEALAWQTKTEQWTKDQGQFIPHPATWLNQSRWMDEPDKRITGPKRTAI